MLSAHYPITVLRLLTVFIFSFCLTMTCLLVRSVLFPEHSRLASVSPQSVFELFASRSEGNDMDVLEGNRIVGRCRITPLSGPPVPNRRLDSVRLAINGTLQLRGPFAAYGLLSLNNRLDLGVDGTLNAFDVSLRLNQASPPLELQITQPPEALWPAISFKRGNDLIFQSESGKEPDEANRALMNLLVSAAGLSPDLLGKARAEAAATTITARAGRITVGDQALDGYLVAAEKQDHSPAFRLYLAATGEILRADTPLGLELRSASHRPPGAVVPDLDDTRLLNP